MSGYVVLFDEKKLCCGCGACMNICPTNSISMKEDEEGFVYPTINRSTCVDCGRCKQICGYQKADVHEKAQKAWAVVAKQKDVLCHSASGGAFAVFAEYVLSNEGTVYGCSLCRDKDELSPKHIRIDNIAELRQLQGSKYVQSDIQYCYRSVRKDLEMGKEVLFSGTPCQIGGLKAYLGKEYAQLYTLDLVCHGTPSKKFFQEYLRITEKQLGGKILDYKFRDKTFGWSLRGAVTWEKRNGRIAHRQLPVNTSSYYRMFLDADIYRDSCYSCPYAQEKRTGDVTIGDYWGIEIEHPEVLEGKRDLFLLKQGVSCMLANTPKGEWLIERCSASMELLESSPEKVIRHNSQLQKPSDIGGNRASILQMYRDGGYEVVHKWCNKKAGIKRLKSEAICRLPIKVQVLLHKILDC